MQLSNDASEATDSLNGAKMRYMKMIVSKQQELHIFV